ncbi:MAG: TIM barrel protein [Theionarchaea archaeon]|nr:TIM barrel protein [Theionarchaea archaeon]
MKFGVAGIPLDFKKHGTIRGIKSIKELGLDALEYPMGHGIRLKSETAHRIGASGREHGVEVSLHAPYYLNFAAGDESIMKWSRALHQTVELAECMNASITVIHPGWISGDDDRALCLKRTIENLREFSSETIGIETMGKLSAIGHFSEVLDICAATGHRPVMDFAHIHSLQPLQSKNDFSSLFDRIESVLGHQDHFHTHFTGVEVKNGEEKKHLPMRGNEPNFAYLAETCIESGYDITVICESPELDRDALEMKKIYSSLLADSPERSQ